MKISALEEMFLSVCSDWFSRNNGFKVRGELGVFSSAAVVWLGIAQRFSGGSLQTGVSELVSRAESGALDSLVKRPGQKLRAGAVSFNTGGLSRARERLQIESVIELFSAATEKIFKTLKLFSRTVYVMDGQILAIARTKANLDKLGKTGNGEGELHFPRIRVVSAHELGSGIARHLSIGTWHDHEVTLGREVLSALPSGSLVIMDRGFDKPAFVQFATKNGLKVIVRLKNSLGIKLIGDEEQHNVEKQIRWDGSSKEGRIVQSGRVIKYTSNVKGFRSSEFYFFTTADELSLEEVADFYRQRVRVETFIRDIKQTLKMFFVSSKKPENIKKEIFIAYLTFNLIRAIMESSAQALEIETERISFTATIRLIKVYANSFAYAKNQQDRNSISSRFITHLYQAKLPLRKNQRNYPRVIKYPRDRYPRAGVVSKSQPGER